MNFNIIIKSTNSAEEELPSDLESMPYLPDFNGTWILDLSQFDATSTKENSVMSLEIETTLSPSACTTNTFKTARSSTQTQTQIGEPSSFLTTSSYFQSPANVNYSVMKESKTESGKVNQLSQLYSDRPSDIVSAAIVTTRHGDFNYTYSGLLYTMNPNSIAMLDSLFCILIFFFF
eukprot:NODE_62_length_26495_cov_0.832853.p17 type:complete len:176 gc:universal NODE_62_length_26495_cov_0.832853:20330-19803(-)